MKQYYPQGVKKGEILQNTVFFELSVDKLRRYQVANNYQILPTFCLTETEKLSIVLTDKGVI